MEQILREARAANMLHGKLGRILQSDYEVHVGVKWQQRAVTVIIVAAVLAVAGSYLHLPTFLSLALLVVGGLVAAVCLVAAFAHAVHGMDYRFGSSPRDTTGDEPLSEKGDKSSN
jgi:hypothetical protein